MLSPPFLTTSHTPFIAKLLQKTAHIVQLFTSHLCFNHTSVLMFEAPPKADTQLCWHWANTKITFLS